MSFFSSKTFPQSPLEASCGCDIMRILALLEAPDAKNDELLIQMRLTCGHHVDTSKSPEMWRREWALMSPMSSNLRISEYKKSRCTWGSHWMTWMLVLAHLLAHLQGMAKLRSFWPHTMMLARHCYGWKTSQHGKTWSNELHPFLNDQMSKTAMENFRLGSDHCAGYQALGLGRSGCGWQLRGFDDSDCTPVFRWC